MAKIVEMEALTVHPSKYDSEFFELNIQGKFNKAEMQFLIQKLDNVTHH